jgi:TPR repeat protein
MKRAFSWIASLALLGAAPVAAQSSQLVQRLEALAALGSGEAAYHLGMIYHLGLSEVAKDPAKALEQFKLAAERGDALGAYKLGCFYVGQGDGAVETDARLALHWKLVAAKAGYALAQEDVAEILLRRGDAADAFSWYEAAARQGSPRALMLLAVLYDPQSGDAGTAPDEVKSYAYMAIFFNSAPSPQMTIAGAEILAEKAKHMSLLEVERAKVFVRDWREERTLLTRRADLGLSAAEKLVAAAGKGDRPASPGRQH